MKERSFPPLFLLLLLVGISSCKSVREPELKGIGNVKLENANLLKPELGLEIYYFNPNNYSIKIKKAEGDAWLNDRPLGHFTLDTLIHIGAQSDFLLPVKLEMDMKNLPLNASLIMLAKEVNLKIIAVARVGKGIIYINYPFKYEGKQDLKELFRSATMIK